MQTVLLVVHMMIAAALVVVVLVQRSEGGALGIGGGGGFMSGRGAANALTRLTAYLAAGFFSTSIALALLANHANEERSIFDTPASATAPAVPGAAPAKTDAPAIPGDRGGVLDKLQQPGGGQTPVPRAPQGQ
jgi:preprotein translocase subunit SecG